MSPTLFQIPERAPPKMAIIAFSYRSTPLTVLEEGPGFISPFPTIDKALRFNGVPPYMLGRRDCIADWTTDGLNSSGPHLGVGRTTPLDRLRT